MRHALPIVAAVLAGCATPMTLQQTSSLSDPVVCELTIGGPNMRVAEEERRRRALDCTPHYPAAYARREARQAQQNADLQFFLQSIQRPAAAPMPPPRHTNCRTHRVGNDWQTTCF